MLEIQVYKIIIGTGISLVVVVSHIISRPPMKSVFVGFFPYFGMKIMFFCDYDNSQIEINSNVLFLSFFCWHRANLLIH